MRDKKDWSSVSPSQAEKFRQWREAIGITQEDVAIDMGVTPKIVYRIENARTKTKSQRFKKSNIDNLKKVLLDRLKNQIDLISKEARNWHANMFKYTYIHKLNDLREMVMIVLGIPDLWGSAEDPVLDAFCLSVALHYSGNCVYWIKKNNKNSIAIKSILCHYRQLEELNWFRPKVRGMFALQYLDRTTLEELIESASLDGQTMSFVRKYVMNNEIMSYVADQQEHKDDYIRTRAGKVRMELEDWMKQLC